MIELLHETQRRAMMARFAKYAYMDHTEARQAAKSDGLNKTEFYDIDGAQAYIFFNAKDLIISCRGTQPGEMNDIMADLEVFKSDSVTGTKIHQGFKEEVDKVYDVIEERVGAQAIH